MGVLTQAVNRHGYAPPQFDGRYLRLYEATGSRFGWLY